MAAVRGRSAEARPDPALEWKPVLVAGRPPVALLLSVELPVHRPGPVVREEKAELPQEGGDPLPAQARMLDSRHREPHQRPVSAETLRKEPRVGAQRSRQLAAIIRGSLNGDGAG
ncbi:hypothetical protein ACVNF4_11550 [Streptomyces sp. S6]